MKVQLNSLSGAGTPMFAFAILLMVFLQIPYQGKAQVLVISIEEVIGKAEVEADPNEQFSVLLYPNPAQSYINLRPSSASITIQGVDIFDSHGAWVASVNLSSGMGQVALNPGVYAFKIQLQDHPPIHKMVVISS